MSMRWLVMVLAAMACGGGAEPSGGGEGLGATVPEIPSGPLQGTIDGTAWQAGEGAGFAYDDGQLEGELTEADLTCDEGADFDDLTVEIEVPSEPGTYALGGPDASVLLLTRNGSVFTTVGQIRVDSVTDTRVEGALVVEADDDNSVGGSFALTVCP